MQKLRTYLPILILLLIGGACIWLVISTGSVPEPPPMTRVEPADAVVEVPEASADWGPWETKAETARVVEPEVEAPVETPASVPGNGVKGRVFNVNGAPIAGVELYINRQQMETGASADAITGKDGRFILTNPPASGFRLAAYHAEHPPAHRTVASNHPESQEIRIVLEDGGSVEGRVLLSGKPLAGAHVTLGPVAGQYRKVEVDRQGRYRIGGIAPGRYDIMARYNSGQLDRHTSRQVTIQLSRATEQDFLLYGGGSGIKGKILVGDKPALRTRINGVVTLLDGEREIFNHEIAGGEYLIDELPPGRLNFNVHVLEFEGQHTDGLSPYAGRTDDLRRSESLDLNPGQIVERDFTFYPAVGVRGTVSGVRTDERASVLVLEGYREITDWTMETFLTLAAQKIRSQRVGDGTFIVNDLPPRDYTLLAYAEPKDVTGDPDEVLANLRMDMLYIQLAPGEMQEVRLELR